MSACVHMDRECERFARRVERLAREHVLGRIQQRVGCSKKGTEGPVKGLAYDNDRIDIKHTLSHLVWVTHTHTHTR